MNSKILTFIIMAALSTNTFAQSNSRKALLILDIQDDFTGANARMPMEQDQATEMINRLNDLVSRLDRSAFEIIYIGNEFRRFDLLNLFRNFAAIEKTPGIKMDKRLRVVTNHYFQKNKENAFTNPALQKFLDSQSVGELYITGLKAEACVWSTAQGALKRQYKVNVLTDCIATTSQKKKERTIKKYRQLGIGVLTSEKIALK